MYSYYSELIECKLLIIMALSIFLHNNYQDHQVLDYLRIKFWPYMHKGSQLL